MPNTNDKSSDRFCKLFIGGLNFSSDEEVLRKHFEKWGELVDVVVMRLGGRNGKSRGFGFVTFKEPEMLDAAQASRPHVINNRSVETKRAIPRDEHNSSESNSTTNKLFVGALKKEVEADDLIDYFSTFGKITECEVIKSRETGQSRGFGFITFDDYDSVDKVILHKPHSLDNKRCEVKKAISKEESRSLKAQETVRSTNGVNIPPEQDNDLMGFIGQLRDSLSRRFEVDNQRFRGIGGERRFGQYEAQNSFSGGPLRGYMSHDRTNQPYGGSRGRRGEY